MQNYIALKKYNIFKKAFHQMIAKMRC